MASWEIGERNDDDFAGEIIELNGFFFRQAMFDFHASARVQLETWYFHVFLVDFSGKVIASLPTSQVPHYQHWLKPPSNTWKAICSRQLDDLDIYVPISRFLTHLDIYFLNFLVFQLLKRWNLWKPGI